jgi:hypothetical protein
LAQPDRKELRDQLDHKVQQDRKVSKEILDRLAQYQKCLDRLAPQAQQVHKV